jgi:hypothetical protein
MRILATQEAEIKRTPVQRETPEYKKKRAVGFGAWDTANCARTKSAFSNGPFLGSWPCSSLWARNGVLLLLSRPVNWIEGLG